MDRKGRRIWVLNRTAWGFAISIVFGLVLGFFLWVLFLPMPPLWACAISWSIGIPAFFIVLARILIFWVGISDDDFVFVKLYRSIKIIRSEIASLDIAPPVDSSELEVPLLKIKDRAMTFKLQSGESIEVSPIEGPLAYRLHVDFMGEDDLS